MNIWLKCSKGKVLEHKKQLQPLLGTPEGIYRGCTISFSTSTASAVHPIVQLPDSGLKIKMKHINPLIL